MKEDLFRSLNRLSVAGTAVMSFAVIMIVLVHSGFELKLSILISAALSAIVTLARVVGGIR